MLVNYAYHVPLGCILIGFISVMAGFVTLLVMLGSKDDASQRRVSHYMLVVCGLGAVFLVVGCCSCCSVYNRIRRNCGLVLSAQDQRRTDASNYPGSR